VRRDKQVTKRAQKEKKQIGAVRIGQPLEPTKLRGGEGGPSWCRVTGICGEKKRTGGAYRLPMSIGREAVMKSR